jgi:hypothetical protein
MLHAVALGLSLKHSHRNTSSQKRPYRNIPSQKRPYRNRPFRKRASYVVAEGWGGVFKAPPQKRTLT